MIELGTHQLTQKEQPPREGVTLVDLENRFSTEINGLQYLELSEYLVDTAFGTDFPEEEKQEIYKNLQEPWENVQTVDKMHSFEQRTEAHSRRNGLTAMRLYVIHEYVKKHPHDHNITQEKLAQFSLNAEQQQRAALLALAGITHDFGKGEVEKVDPDGTKTYYHERMLTMKPGETPKKYDYDKMAKHTDQGAIMLGNIFKKNSHNHTAKTLITIAQRHHEEWILDDGYELSENLRISAIADQYDAKRQPRNYRPYSLYETPEDAKADTVIQRHLTHHHGRALQQAFSAYVDLYFGQPAPTAA